MHSPTPSGLILPIRNNNMKKFLTCSFLLFILPICLQAQKGGEWASARERRLRGAIRTLLSTCTDIKSQKSIVMKYEFAHDGTLLAISAPQLPNYSGIHILPVKLKITGRNAKGDVVETSIMSSDGEVWEQNRRELEYDVKGNWIKETRSLMKNYQEVGSDWKEGEWRTIEICNRTIEYFP